MKADILDRERARIWVEGTRLGRERREERALFKDVERSCKLVIVCWGRGGAVEEVTAFLYFDSANITASRFGLQSVYISCMDCSRA